MSSVDKYCTGCKQTLSITQFHNNRAKPDGLSNVCKECAKKAYDSWRERNREKYDTYKREFYQNNKEKFAEYKRSAYYNKKHKNSKDLVTLLKIEGCKICGGFSHLRVDKDHPTLTVICTHCHAATRRHTENELLLLYDFKRQQTFRKGFH